MKVATGFWDVVEIVEATMDYFEGSESLDEQQVQAETERLIRAHAQAQAAWPRVTDCDRLLQVFSQLERRGIICREDFTCCMTCGTSEIGDEMEEAGGKAKVKGYVFYHRQDLEGAVESGELMLAFGAWDGTPESGGRIGTIVADALRAGGLTVDWNGTFKKRIAVRIDWKRRRAVR
jgi:hypothetical protein